MSVEWECHHKINVEPKRCHNMNIEYVWHHKVSLEFTWCHKINVEYVWCHQKYSQTQHTPKPDAHDPEEVPPKKKDHGNSYDLLINILEN
jgi:hypothetical protein